MRWWVGVLKIFAVGIMIHFYGVLFSDAWRLIPYTTILFFYFHELTRRDALEENIKVTKNNK
jgi:hypothetical protein